MTANDKIFYQVRYLLAKSLDGSITDEEIRRLETLIIEHPQARQYYVEFLQIHIHLRKLLQHDPVQIDDRDHTILDVQLWEQLARHEQRAESIYIEQPELEEDKSKVEKPMVIPQRQKVNKLSLYAAVTSAAAFILLLAYVHLSPMLFKPVAVVADQLQGAVLFQSSIPAIGPELYPGSYTMEKGLIELAFMDGGKVVIEAPSEFVIENASKIYLLKGQLTVLVENSPKSFIVRTLNSNIVDFGTEFGVRANADGTTEAHVFQGKVRMESNEQPQQAALMLEGGQAAHADSAGILSRREANPLQFVRLEEFSVKKQAAKGSAYCRWQEQVYQIHRDPALVAHYTFQRDKRHPDQLKNQAPGTRNQLVGILEGQESRPQWAQGRWAQKTALYFDRSQNQWVRIPSDPKICITGPITLGAWIKMEEAPAGFVPGMHGGNIISNGKDQTINYNLAYGLYYHGHMMIYMRAHEIDFHTIGPEIDLSIDEWHFLSVTHDNYFVRFYIDGKLMKTAEKFYNSQPIQADLIIGGMEAMDQPKYRFNGFIDEVLIFNRILSEEEMQVLYDTGKPQE